MFCEGGLPLPLTISSVIDTLDAEGRKLARAHMRKTREHLEVGLEGLQVKLANIAEGRDLYSNVIDHQSALPVPHSMYYKLPYVTTKGWHGPEWIHVYL